MRGSNSSSRVMSSKRPKRKGCPKGTVPIMKYTSNPIADPKNGVKYYATMATNREEGATYHGGTALMGVFSPHLQYLQSSRANIWVQNGPQSHLNSIEAGWAVHEILYNDPYTRLTAYWTADNFGTTGCYNLVCPGFVQIDSSVYLGQSYPVDPFNRDVILNFIVERI
ncbi:hypothetical protein CCACVL1_14589, partial [Corchorus capsularis]